MDALHPTDRLEILDRNECLELLATQEIGRLGFVANGRVRITPVNYCLVNDDVIVMSRPGAKLDAATRQQHVAFEVDSVEQWADAGWSVLVEGAASVITDPAEMAQLSAQGPRAWAPTPEHQLIRIAADDVSGRRVRVEAGGVTVIHQTRAEFD